MEFLDFDHNGVLSPHRGDPTDPGELSPYPCSIEQFCRRFAYSKERIELLERFLDFRGRVVDEGITTGFQWIGGSFLEEERLRNRPPSDIDVVTVYWGYDFETQIPIMQRFPEFASWQLAKQNFSIDHYPFDAWYTPQATIENTRYWISLFTHTRDSVWKGMLKIALPTDVETEARELLTRRRHELT